MTVERVLVKDYWVQRGDLKIIQFERGN